MLMLVRQWIESVFMPFSISETSSKYAALYHTRGGFPDGGGVGSQTSITKGGRLTAYAAAAFCSGV